MSFRCVNGLISSNVVLLVGEKFDSIRVAGSQNRLIACHLRDIVSAL